MDDQSWKEHAGGCPAGLSDATQVPAGLLGALPNELLQEIFAFACTDGGYTGCSLSRVSSHVREITRLSRFHSILLIPHQHPDQLRQFIACFTAERAAADATSDPAPRVRHLYVTHGGRQVDQTEYPMPSELDHEYRTFQNQVLSLLELVAQDLYTLCMAAGPRSLKTLPLPEAVGKIPFPLLKELTIVDLPLPFAPLPALDRVRQTPPDWASIDASAFPPLPCITHLHLASCYPAQNLHCWAQRSPGVTHLRVAGASMSEYGMRRHVLSSIRNIVAPGAAGTDEGQPTFERLELVLLEPFKDLRWSQPWSRGPSLIDMHAVYSLTKLERLAERYNKCFVRVLPEKKTDEGEMELKARTDWIDRMNGGLGCWVYT